MRRWSVVGSLLLTAGFCQAETVMFYLNSPFYGGPSPTWSGTPPALVMTFTDIGANAVQLTLDTSSMSSTEAVKSWYFNLLGINTSALVFTHVSGVQAQSISTGSNCCKADGVGGYFDVLMRYPTGAANRFTGGGTSVYNISALGLSAASFRDTSLGTTYFGAAHIISLPNGQSTWIATPEPSSYLLLGSVVGALGLALFRRKRLINRG